MSLIELPELFEGKGEVKGYTFSLVERSDEGYVYGVVSDTDTSKIHYEVFKRKEVSLFDWETKQAIEGSKIRYPKSNDFGVWAWTCKKYSEAIKKLDYINSLKDKE